MSGYSNYQQFLQFSILVGLPSFFSTIVLVLSYKKEALLDLLSPAYFISASILSVVVNTTGIVGEQNEVMRQQQIYYLIISYVNLGQFMLSTQLACFIARILYIYLTMLYLVLTRHLHGDENSLIAAAFLTGYFTLFCESSVFVNMKARVRLFLKMRTSKQ